MTKKTITSKLIINFRALIGVFLLILLLETGTVALAGEGKTRLAAGESGATLDDYLSTASVYGFSGVVLIARGGKIVLHRGYNFADRENLKPNNREMIFDIVSLTKQFTAAAIMKLEMQGKLNTNGFDDDRRFDERGRRLRSCNARRNRQAHFKRSPQVGAGQKIRIFKYQLHAAGGNRRTCFRRALREISKPRIIQTCRDENDRLPAAEMEENEISEWLY
jgi:hypothetical protein